MDISVLATEHGVPRMETAIIWQLPIQWPK